MKWLSFLLNFALSVLFVACGSGVKPIGISLSPGGAVTIVQGQQKNVSVSVSNDSKSQGVSWALSGTGCSGAACGTLTNVTTTSVTYNTPASVTSNLTVIITATSVADTAKSASITITVAPLPSVTTTSLPNGVQNATYPATSLAASGGITPYTWTITAGALPAGMTLSSAGTISGKPTAVGTSSFTAQVADASSPALTATKDLSITITPPPLTITTTSLPGGTINSVYTATTLQSTGGTAPINWTVTTGSLPAGLTLNSATGVLSGTPTVSGTIDFTVTATDSATPPEVKTKALSIVINPALSVTTSSLPDGSQDAAYSVTMASTGGTSPVSWAVSVGTLPAGLTLNAGTGVISGTPTTAGKVNFTVEATDSSTPKQTSAVALSITIAPPPLTITTTSLPDGTVNSVYASTTLQYSGGTSPVTWAVTTGVLPAGLTLDGSTGVISGTPTAAGTANFTVTATDSEPTPATKTKALSIVVNPALSITTTSLPDGAMNTPYTATLTSTGGTPAVGWNVSLGALPAGLTLNSSTGVISGTPTALGKVDFTVEATDHSTPPQTPELALSITITAAPLAITTTSLPGATVNSDYTSTLQATGGTPPIAWTVTAGSLPAGLTLHSATGVIDGKPTTSGTDNFTVTATDSDTPVRTKTQDLSIVVVPAFTITTSSLPDGAINTAYPATTLTVTGGTPPITWSVSSGTLPAGLSLNSSTGVISGTPSAAGSSNFSIRATDHSTPPQTPEVSLSITIAAAPLTITTTVLPNGTIGAAYSATLQADGGTPPITWTVTAGALPGWASLDGTTGEITGTPTGSPATTNFSVTATDAGSPVQTKQQALSITTVTGGVNNAELNGHYAFILRGFDSIGGGLVTRAGSFVADGNGNVTGGVEDINSTSSIQTNLAVTGGFYSVGADQRGTMTLTTSQGSSTFAFALGGISSGISAGGRIIEADTKALTGNFKKQDTSAFSTASITGSFAFGIGGAESTGRFAAAGVLTADGAGTFTAVVDGNDSGSIHTDTFAGNYAFNDSANGRGTLTDTTNGSHMAMYVISANEVFIIGADAFGSSGPPIFTGSAQKQSGTFSKASMNGNIVMAAQSISGPSSSYTGIGVFACNGNGAITGGSVDENDGGVITQASGTGTYTVASNGRMTMTMNGNPMPTVFYLIGPGKAYSVGTNGAVSEGLLKPQSGSSFTNASLSGSFIFGSEPPVMNAPVVDIGVVTLDGAGNVTGTSDENQGGTFTSNHAFTDTYTVAPNGRVVISNNLMYIISNSKAVMMSARPGEPNPTIDTIDK